MITKKKKYTLYYVMALACGLVASFFIYSCSADGYYSDEIEKNEVTNTRALSSKIINNGSTLIDSIASSDEFWEFEMSSELLADKFHEYTSTLSDAESLRGLLNHKLIPVILKAAGIPVHEHTERISQKQTETLCRQIQTFPVRLKKVRDFSAAQVCTGGIHTEEIHTDTLESRIVPGIYFVGELLDVDGICGGYNLQWAWSSGHVAGSKVGS